LARQLQADRLGFHVNLHRVVDIRQLVFREFDIEGRTDDLNNLADAFSVCRSRSHDDSVNSNLRYFNASAPPTISAISLVIWAWRTRLYCRAKSFDIVSADSVACFIATRRAICSLTAASRKALNSRTLNDTGRICSRISFAAGRNSYSTVIPPFGFSDTGASGSNVSTTAICRAALMNLV